ncbi:MAG: HEAT repeat domain-containing protein [Candidatus Riflebacteria bacterium]|nr:HEAT repeat domain-containing protein [Candidatus Riflebacteria bacterium]
MSARSGRNANGLSRSFAGFVGGASIPALTAALEGDCEPLRAEATSVLGKVHGTPTVPRLLECLTESRTSESSRVRKAAAESLGCLGQTSAVSALIHVLQTDQESLVRAAAAEALEQLRHSSAVPSLIAALQTDSDAGVRSAAARFLAPYGARLRLFVSPPVPGHRLTSLSTSCRHLSRHPQPTMPRR